MKKREIDEFDIHWRNSELLCKYLNTAGKIKHRFQTRLPSDQHRKVVKTIRLSREMCNNSQILQIKIAIFIDMKKKLLKY